MAFHPQSGLYLLFLLVSLGYLTYNRFVLSKNKKAIPPLISEKRKNEYRSWLSITRQKMPNEPSVVYKYWFLTYQKTENAEEREKLLKAFIEKKEIIQKISHDSIGRIIEKLDSESNLDQEFVRQLYFHFLMLTTFSDEKTKLEALPISKILLPIDPNEFQEYLNQTYFDIAFIDLLPDKLKELSNYSQLKNFDANIVNFFDEDPNSGIELNTDQSIITIAHR
jgi:hypothetical protein